MSIISILFGESASPLTWLQNKAEEVLLNLEKLGNSAFMPRLGEDAVNTLRGRERKEKAEADARNATTITAQQLREQLNQSFEALEQTAREFEDGMNDLNARIQAQIDAIDAQLDDPNASFTEAERKAMEEQRLQLHILQQRAIDEKALGMDEFRQTERDFKDGKITDPSRMDDAAERLKERQNNFESEFESISNSIILPNETDLKSVSPQSMSVSVPAF